MSLWLNSQLGTMVVNWNGFYWGDRRQGLWSCRALLASWTQIVRSKLWWSWKTQLEDFCHAIFSGSYRTIKAHALSQDCCNWTEYFRSLPGCPIFFATDLLLLNVFLLFGLSNSILPCIFFPKFSDTVFLVYISCNLPFLTGLRPTIFGYSNP